MKTFMTQGVCSQAIQYEVQDGVLTACRFVGGCPGNTVGIAALVEGMDAKEAAEKLRGIRCGFKPTSCPDQLAKALLEAVSQV